MACVGFAVFGWTYFLATFGLWPERNGVTAPPFLTKALLDVAQPPSRTTEFMTVEEGPAGEMSILTPDPPKVPTTVPGTVNIATRAPFAGRVVSLLHYRRIGHLLATIAFALLGALLGTIFFALGEAGERRLGNRMQQTGQ